MSKYNFNISTFHELLPSVMKDRVRLVGLTDILLSPLRRSYSEFLEYMSEKTYRLEHTGQVYSLERLIRDHCGDEGCRITDGKYVDETMVPYDGSESLANYQVDVPYDGGVEPQVAVAYAGYGQAEMADFIVHLPGSLSGAVDEAQLRSLIDGYKVAGKSYSITYE